MTSCVDWTKIDACLFKGFVRDQEGRLQVNRYRIQVGRGQFRIDWIVKYLPGPGEGDTIVVGTYRSLGEAQAAGEDFVEKGGLD